MGREEISLQQLELASRKQRKRQIEIFLKEARQSEERGDLVSALGLYNKVLALDPEHTLSANKAEDLRQHLQFPPPTAETEMILSTPSFFIP